MSPAEHAQIVIEAITTYDDGFFYSEHHTETVTWLLSVMEELVKNGTP